MRSKRLSSRGAGVGVGSGGSGSTSSSFAATTTTTCHPISELDESVAIDAKELRELMDDSATGLETAVEGEEEEEDEGDEDRDQYVADLCSRFEGAAMTTAKRKFSDAVAEEEENEANGSLGGGRSTLSSGGDSTCSATAGLPEGTDPCKCWCTAEIMCSSVGVGHLLRASRVPDAQLFERFCRARTAYRVLSISYHNSLLYDRYLSCSNTTLFYLHILLLYCCSITISCCAHGLRYNCKYCPTVVPCCAAATTDYEWCRLCMQWSHGIGIARRCWHGLNKLQASYGAT